MYLLCFKWIEIYADIIDLGIKIPNICIKDEL